MKFPKLPSEFDDPAIPGPSTPLSNTQTAHEKRMIQKYAIITKNTMEKNNQSTIALERWHRMGFLPAKRKAEGSHGPITPEERNEQCSKDTVAYALGMGIRYNAPHKEHGFLLEKRCNGRTFGQCIFCKEQYPVEMSTIVQLNVPHWVSKYCCIIEGEIHVMKASDVQRMEQLIPHLQIRYVLLAPQTKPIAHAWHPNS